MCMCNSHHKPRHIPTDADVPTCAGPGSRQTSLPSPSQDHHERCSPSSHGNSEIPCFPVKDDEPRSLISLNSPSVGSQNNGNNDTRQSWCRCSPCNSSSPVPRDCLHCLHWRLHSFLCLPLCSLGSCRYGPGQTRACLRHALLPRDTVKTSREGEAYWVDVPTLLQDMKKFVRISCSQPWCLEICGFLLYQGLEENF